MKKRRDFISSPRSAYTTFWLWSIVVNACFFYLLHFLSCEDEVLIGPLLKVMSGISGVTSDEFSVEFKILLAGFLLVLTLWRINKVLVLQGSPLAWGMNVSSGRENEGTSGRQVHFMHIGKRSSGESEKSSLHYGAVFRAHPNSDKLVRARLEFLVLSIFPFNLAFMVNESRIKIDVIEHEVRWTIFGRILGGYSQKSEFVKPDRFRQELMKNTANIAKYLQEQAEMVDGLIWSDFDRHGMIKDKFGYLIQYELREDERYEVRGLEPDGKGTKVVDSLDELRELAREVLTPVGPNAT